MLEKTTDVDGLLRRRTAKQFRAWEHFIEIEPFSFDVELRADFRTASIVQVIANVNRGKGQKAYTLEDFLLKFNAEPQPRRQTWQQQLAIATAIAMAFNAPGLNS
jgi:hypothetical protein